MPHARSRLLTVLLLCLSCAAHAEVRKLRVEHYLQPNTRAGGKLCYVVSGGGTVQVLDQPIAGFTWEWGTVYQITVNVDRVAQPDGSVGLRYALVSVDSQSRVAEGTRFEMYLFDRTFIQGRTIMGAKDFKCASARVEEELKRRLDNFEGKATDDVPGASPAKRTRKQSQPPEETRRVLLEFSHPKTAAEPLILEGITGAGDLGLE